MKPIRTTESVYSCVSVQVPYFLLREDVPRIPPSKFNAISEHAQDMLSISSLFCARPTVANLAFVLGGLCSGIGALLIVTIHFLESIRVFDFPIQLLVESVIIHFATREILNAWIAPTRVDGKKRFRTSSFAKTSLVLVSFCIHTSPLLTKRFSIHCRW